MAMVPQPAQLQLQEGLIVTCAPTAVAARIIVLVGATGLQEALFVVVIEQTLDPVKYLAMKTELGFVWFGRKVLTIFATHAVEGVLFVDMVCESAGVGLHNVQITSARASIKVKR